MNKSLNLVGMKFGLLTVISKKDKHPKYRTYMFECKCDCGGSKNVCGPDLKRGAVKSCGCYDGVSKHKMSDHPLYTAWLNIKARCYNINNPKHEFYKGVKMCKEWKSDFKSFFDWAIKNGWQSGMQIDKDIIPKSLGISKRVYSPEMCCIVSGIKNRRASSHTKITYEQAVEIRKSKLPPRALAPIYGLTPRYISSIKSGKKWKIAD